MISQQTDDYGITIKCPVHGEHQFEKVEDEVATYYQCACGEVFGDGV